VTLTCALMATVVRPNTNNKIAGKCFIVFSPEYLK
jgi:hypothetical protein